MKASSYLGEGKTFSLQRLFGLASICFWILMCSNCENVSRESSIIHWSIAQQLQAVSTTRRHSFHGAKSNGSVNSTTSPPLRLVPDQRLAVLSSPTSKQNQPSFLPAAEGRCGLGQKSEQASTTTEKMPASRLPRRMGCLQALGEN